MRIISGNFKGRRIDPIPGMGIRPTTDRAREALFNILHHSRELEGARVLDLCTGSGAMALEFCSRGAASVTTIEQNARVVAHVRSIAKTWGAAQLAVQQADAGSWLARAVQGGVGYDIVFMDPPYRLPGKELWVQHSLQLLAPVGLVVLEHDPAETFDHIPAFTGQRTYSGSAFSFFEKEEDNISSENGKEDADMQADTTPNLPEGIRPATDVW